MLQVKENRSLLNSSLSPLSPLQTRLYYWVIFSTVLAFLPSKALGQIIPIIFVIGLLFYVRWGSGRNFIRLLNLFYILVGLGIFYSFLYQEFFLPNYILFLVTASAFIPFLFDFKSVISTELLHKISRTLLMIITIQALVGIVQAIAGFFIKGTLDSDTGDLVRGTLELGFSQNATASNQMYVILISSLLIFVLATQIQLSLVKFICVCIILAAWLLASVLHTLIYFSLALAGTIFLNLFIGHRRLALRIMLIAIPISLCFIFTLTRIMPRNIATLPYFAERLIQISEDSPSLKARTTYRTFVILPEKIPIQKFVGLGPGQYSSRAALISSGEYLKISLLPFQYVHVLSQQYIIDAYINIRGTAISSTEFPFYSWMTVYAETGFIGLIMVIFFFAKQVLFSLRHRSGNFHWLNMTIILLVFYLMFLGFHDNYWEFTQAMFPMCLMLSLSISYLRKDSAFTKASYG